MFIFFCLLEVMGVRGDVKVIRKFFLLIISYEDSGVYVDVIL